MPENEQTPLPETSGTERTPMETAALAIYYHVAQMIKEGKTEQEILNILEEQGIKPETAHKMLAKLNESRSNVTRTYGRRNRAVAFVSIGSGVLLLLLTQNVVVWLVSVALIIAGIYWWARASLQMNIR